MLSDNEVVARDFPTKLDFLAKFGVKPVFDSLPESFTYIFENAADEVLTLTFSPLYRDIEIVMSIASRTIFSVSFQKLEAICMVDERGVSWLFRRHRPADDEACHCSEFFD